MSEGGGIYGYLGFQIYNSIVINNRCWEGGGICGSANLEFVKVYNNFALHHGGVTSDVKYDARSKIKYNWFTNT